MNDEFIGTLEKLRNVVKTSDSLADDPVQIQISQNPSVELTGLNID
jgi:hypothetical protein